MKTQAMHHLSDDYWCIIIPLNDELYTMSNVLLFLAVLQGLIMNVQRKRHYTTVWLNKSLNHCFLV